MADGLNKAFQNDPDTFMRDNPVDIYPFRGEGMDGGVETLGKGSDQPDHQPRGPAEFDLAKSALTGLVRLRLFAERPKLAANDSNRITAYWLPWNPAGTATVSFAALNASGAKFLFTSSLGGCRILITPTDLHHISGQLNQQARVAATAGLTGGERARAFSSSSGNAYGDGAFIVGYRAKAGLRRQRTGDWNFVAQTASRQGLGNLYAVDRIWLNNGLFLIN